MARELLSTLPLDRAIFRMEHYADLYPATTPALVTAAVGSLDASLDNTHSTSSRKKLGAFGTLGTALTLLVACGGNTPSVAPSTPTFSPTEAPSSTAVVTPTPEASASLPPTPLSTPTENPTGTPVKTASPTPRATETVKPSETPGLLGINTIIKDNPDPITKTQLRDLIKTAYENNSNYQDILNFIDRCATDEFTTDNCLAIIEWTYGNNQYNIDYLHSGDMARYDVANGFYRWAYVTHKNNPGFSNDKQSLDDALKNEFPSSTAQIDSSKTSGISAIV